MISHIEPIEFKKAAEHLIVAGGKRARSAIALLACEAVGGEPKFALPAAVSCEFVHTASLVHDDIIDSNETRRGRESVHIKWGIPTGVLTGDLLLAMATNAMLDLARRIALFTPDGLSITNMSKSAFDDALNVLSIFTNAWVKLCQGKEMDSLLKSEKYVTEADVIKLMYQKTAILYELAAKGGAMAGNGTSEEVKALGEYGKLTGLAFQIKDDILGLLADEIEFGKHVGADIREGKKTVMVVYALNNGGDKSAIFEALGNKDATTNQILSAIDAIKDAGSVNYAKRLAKSIGERGKNSLEILPQSNAKNHLIAISDYLIDEGNW